MSNEDMKKLSSIRASCRSSTYKINEMEGQLKSLRVNIEGFEIVIKGMEVNAEKIEQIKLILDSDLEYTAFALKKKFRKIIEGKNQ